MERAIYNYWISNIKDVGAVTIEKLLNAFGNAEEVFGKSRHELEVKTHLNNTVISNIINSRNIEKIQVEYAKLQDSGIYFVSKEDKLYPERLRHIYGAPFSFYVRGNIPKDNEKTLAIIGARECSPYGKEMARYFAKSLAAEGVSIISGLARGIDCSAHQGALDASGVTYGILGCGIDICYPRENIKTYMKMQSKGGIISEYAPGTPPMAHNFPMRNRIISAVSDGILVIEAKNKSGSLITVDMGLDQGKNIFALPGRLSDRLSEGCNNLIKIGAKLVTNPADILEEYFMNDSKKHTDNSKENITEQRNKYKLLESKGKIVYANLSFEPKHIDIIAIETKLAIDCITQQLLMMELQGLIRQPMRNYYMIEI